ncbi:hypothetical protein B0T16DRAFT_414922 [Cercophora newfieldiana]|uniref:Peptidase S8/S53 domain-containing protein n=1 Tax=Cercophora newfieldiana TaxID=92897 RepID=A0AA40CMY0_9PEZI|nr:hypothetical protein B0T16DRAFT_414922 [Cercophora newfieldiana]
MDPSAQNIPPNSSTASEMDDESTDDSPEDILDDLQHLRGLDGVDLDTDAGLAMYIRNHRARLLAVNGQERNILHCHAQQRRFRGPQIYAVIGGILRLEPDDGPSMMTHKDTTHRTPLHHAIMQQNFDWIDHMLQLQYIDTPPNIDWPTIIRLPQPEGGNCLHGAIASSPQTSSCALAYYRVVNALVDLAPPDAFLALDNSGCTPLHLAVDASRIQCKEQVLLVEKLLEKNDISGDDQLNKPDYKSPYRYFKDKRKDWRALMAFKAAAAAHTSRAASIEVRGAGQKAINFRKMEASTELTAPRLSQMSGYSASRSMSSGVGTGIGLVHQRPHRAGGASNPPSPSSPAANQSRPRTGTSSSAPRAEGDARSTTPLARAPVKQQGTSLDEAMKFSTDIKYVLKLHYLRRLQPWRAAEVLYGLNPKSKQIFLDFRRLSKTPRPTSIHVLSFQSQYKNLCLAKTLKYVHLGQVSFVEGIDEDEKPLVCDALFFFTWLKEEKGVRRILHLTVEDGEFPGNSDDTIEKCLEGLQIERLDWRRLDLGVEAKRLGDSKVKSLVLWWGGSNAVLRGWGDTDGIGVVETLEEVQVVLMHGIKLTPRRTRDLQDFKAKLLQVRLERKLEPLEYSDGEDHSTECPLIEDLSDGMAAHPSQHTDQNDHHKWIRCMTDLASHIFHAGIPEIAGASAADGLDRGIKIAVIDDGIEMTDEEIGGRVVGGASLCSGEPDRGVPFYESTRGHGTLVAKFILQIFPLAELYSFRLQPSALVGENGSPRHSFPYESAVKAIDRAHMFGVDIICMAWVVSRSNNQASNEKMEHDFNVVLEKASRPTALDQTAFDKQPLKPTLLFCAVEDTGLDNPDTSYPGSISQGRLIRIGAATKMGSPWSHANNDADYFLPGHKVDGGSEGENYYTEGTDHARRSHPMSGSSIATSFAAGLAGVILHLARVSAILVDSEPKRYQGCLSKDAYADLRTRGRMALAFKNISASAEGNRQQKFVRVWERFQMLCDQLEGRKSANGDERWVAMADTVRNLVDG